MEIQKSALKMTSYRTCLHAGVWTSCVAKEQTLTMAHGPTDRGTGTHSHGCSFVQVVEGLLKLLHLCDILFFWSVLLFDYYYYCNRQQQE